MIKSKVVEELIHFTQNEYPVTSAYFTLSSKVGNHKTSLVELKKMIRYKKNTTYFRQLNEVEKKSVLADFEKILNWFEEELDSSKYVSSICFCQSGTGFWKVRNLRIPLQNEIIIQPKPSIYQLSQLFSQYSRYAVVLVDKSKARIFEQSLGDFTEIYAVEDNAPETVKVGGYRGRQERRVERNIKKGVAEHYKEVANKIFALNKRRDFNWIVLGGRRESVGKFQGILHDYVASKIAGTVEIEPQAPLSEVFSKVQKAGLKARRKYETGLLETFNNKKTANQAVAGIDAVLPMLRDNWVDTLLLQENYRRKGVFCRHCQYIDLSTHAECPKHGGPLERTHNIIEHMLHNALLQGVDVQYLQQSLEQYGYLGAILRFPLTS
ncbi:MAG: hypothetical protein DRP96_00065 [Candidatus Neomarinimicrobiota bacterium]|nr:MAG: hypothetical protein DRP96_00065 [Candidatus Neomarinimicrobiota bacterium]